MYIFRAMIFSLVCTVALSAQPLHDNKSNPFHEKFYIPRVSYTIDAAIQPESLLVHARMEVYFDNREKAPLKKILFHIPVDKNNTSRIHIDSILYRGVPIAQSHLQYNNGILTVMLSRPIYPKEKALFMMSYSCSLLTEKDNKGETFIVLKDWFPQIAVYREGQWYVEHWSPREYATYHVGIRLDTSYALAYQGVLINERDHVGYLPRMKPGTVLVDIASLGIGLDSKQYKPVFTSGYKQYFIKSPVAPDFKAVIRHKWIQDRVMVGGVVITVCYTPEISAMWAGEVANISRDILSYYISSLGPFPYKTLTIAPLPSIASHYGEPFLALSPGIADKNILSAQLAIKIARCWLPELLPDDTQESRYYRNGLADFLATMALYNLYGNEGYRMIQTYRENISSHKSSDQSEWNVATWLYLMNHGEGTDVFRKRLRSFLSDNKYRIVSSDMFYSSVTKSSDMTIPLQEVPAVLDSMDIKIERYHVSSVSDGYIVTGNITMKSPYPFPVEVGLVVNGNDTLLDTVVLSNNGDNLWGYTYTKELKHYPDAVIVDPHFILPDRNRYNNLMFIRRKHHWYRPLQVSFPGFIEIGR